MNRVELPCLLLAELEVFHGRNTKTGLVYHGQYVANVACAHGVGLNHGEGEGRHIILLDVFGCLLWMFFGLQRYVKSMILGSSSLFIWPEEVSLPSGQVQLNSPKLGTQCGESLLDLLVSAVDLVHMVYDAGAVGRKGSNEQRNAGAYVG